MQDIADLCEGKYPGPAGLFSNCVLAVIVSESEIYWQTILRGSQMTEVVAYSIPSYRNFQNGAAVRCAISHCGSEKHKKTPATVVKAAWALTLSKLAGSDDVVFGSLASTRDSNIPFIEQIVGTLSQHHVRPRDLWTSCDFREANFASQDPIRRQPSTCRIRIETLSRKVYRPASMDTVELSRAVPGLGWRDRGDRDRW